MSYTPSGTYTQMGTYTPGIYTPTGTYTSTSSRIAQWTRSALQSYSRSGTTTPLPAPSASSGRSPDEESPSDAYHTASVGSLDADYVTARTTSVTSHESLPAIPPDFGLYHTEVYSADYSTADLCSTECVMAIVCSTEYITAEVCSSERSEWRRKRGLEAS